MEIKSIKELEEIMRKFLEGEYDKTELFRIPVIASQIGDIFEILGEECDEVELRRLSVVLSKFGKISKYVYHDPKFNPRARAVGAKEDEMSICGEAICHFFLYMITRGIDPSQAIKLGVERLLERDGEKQKGKIIMSDTIITLEGFPASPGIAQGTAIVMPFLSEKNFQQILEKYKDVEKILVTDSLSSGITEFVKSIELVGIVTNEGTRACHAAICARESEIPCVPGTRFATKKIKTGDIITVNGSAGEVVIPQQ